MAIGDPYAELDELKAYLRITDDQENGLLVDALASASRGIEEFCHRQFNNVSAPTARVYLPEDDLCVIVDDFHTTDGLVISTDEDDDGVFERTWSVSEYQLSPLNGVVNGRPGWPYWSIRSVGGLRAFPTWLDRATVQVTAAWGWAEVPSTVHSACLILAAERFKLKDAPFGVAGFNEFGAVRVQNNPIAARMLSAYDRDSMLVVKT